MKIENKLTTSILFVDHRASSYRSTAEQDPLSDRLLTCRIIWHLWWVSEPEPLYLICSASKKWSSVRPIFWGEVMKLLLFFLPTFPAFPNLTCFTPRSHKGGDLLNPPFLPSFRSSFLPFVPSSLARSRYGGVSERARHTYYTCNALKDYMSRCRPSFLPSSWAAWRDDSNFHILLFCSFCLWVSIIVNFIIKGVSKISSLLISMHVQTWGCYATLTSKRSRCQ